MRLASVIFLVMCAHSLRSQIMPGIAPADQYPGCAARMMHGTQQPASVADPSVDVLHYRLDLRVDVHTAALSGTVTLKARVVTDSTAALMLDLSQGMTVDSVRLGGQHLLFNRFPQSFAIDFPRPYRTGEIITMSVAYHGTPLSTGFGSFIFSSFADHPWIWSLSEPFGARDWWPCRDHPLDKADSVDVLVTCPTGLLVGSNGKLIGVRNNGDGTSTHHWSEHYPIATYLVSIAIGNYAAFSNWFVYGPTDSLEILNYVLPDHLPQALEALPKTVDMLRVFSTLFGPYPFLREKYGHSEFGRGGAMEHQTMTSTTTFAEDVIAHELAHQWFGDLITCATWQDLWLNEGFATYSESLYREAHYGKPEYWRLIGARLTSAKNAQGSLFQTDTNTIAKLFAVTGVYAKGAAVLHMLRHVVGDTVFFRILRAYVSDVRFRYATATTSDFRDLCEYVSGKSLVYFFDQWVYGESYPSYTLRWSATGAAERTRTTLVISQTSHGSSPSVFTMPIDIRLSAPGRDTTVIVFNSKRSEAFEVTLPFKPTRVELDPDTWILREILEADPLLPERAQLEQNYPNPFNSGTTIAVRLPARIPASVRIYDLLGRRVAILADGLMEPGTHSLRWEGTDESGTPAASGTYFVRLETPAYTISRQLLLLR